jgi:drug/metabolite transporter (DMT)-like permease
LQPANNRKWWYFLGICYAYAVNSTIIVIMLGLGAAIGWGISGFLDAKASRTVRPAVSALLVNGIGTAVFSCLFAISHPQHITLTTSGLIYAIVGGIIIAAGALGYFKGLSIGPVSLTSPMSSAYPLITTVIAVVAFGGKLHLVQYIAVGIILTGIFTVNEFITTIRKRQAMRRGPLWALSAAIGWGIGYALVAQAIKQLGWQTATLFELLAMMAGFAVYIPFIDRQALTAKHLRAGLRSHTIWGAGLVSLAAATSFNLGLSHDASSGAVVATISSFYPILTVLLALRHLEEEAVPLAQLGGAALSIVGVVILSIT